MRVTNIFSRQRFAQYLETELRRLDPENEVFGVPYLSVESRIKVYKRELGRIYALSEMKKP